MKVLIEYLYFMIFIVGLCFGSFLNVVICRIPHGESIAAGRSHCTTCCHTLAWYDLLPLFSFLFVGGKCRYCKAQISWRYPLVESLTGVVFVLVFLHTGLNWALAKYLFLVCLLIVVAFIDLDTQLIPNSLIITGGVGGIILDLLVKDVGLKSVLIGTLVGSGFLLLVAILCEWIMGIEGMGGGDIKLLAMTGIFLGWPLGPFGLLLGILICGIVCLPLLLLKVIRRKQAIPFGPFIVLGTVISLLWGKGILWWYLHLLT